MPTISPTQLADMRSSLADTALAMRCTIERLVAGSQRDAYNQPVQSWATLAADVPCFWWTDRENEVEGPNTNVLISSQYIQLAGDTDIRTTDRIASVTDIDGTVIAERMVIREVNRRVCDVVARVEAQVTD